MTRKAKAITLDENSQTFIPLYTDEDIEDCNDADWLIARFNPDTQEYETFIDNNWTPILEGL